MKTLLLDNYDSFSHILYQYLWEVNGEKPLFLHNDSWTLERIRAARFDNILISPGPGRPDRPSDFGICAEVIRAFPDVPILGVCLGHQGLGLLAGAAITAAPEVRHGKLSRILHDGLGLFAGLPQGFAAVRYHSLVIDPATLPPGLAVTATAQDDGQIMGLRLEKRPCYGVQFHPESIGTEHGKALLANFREIAAKHSGPGSGPGNRGPRPTKALPVLQADSKPPTEAAKGRAEAPARELPWRDPEAVFDRFFRAEPAAFWLDSLAAPVPGESLVSYMGTGSTLFEIRGAEIRTLRIGSQGSLRALDVRQGDPFDFLEARLAEAGPLHGSSGRPGFRGGLVGYLGYELKRHAGGGRPGTDGGDAPGTPASDLPDALVLEPSRMLAFDHAAGKVHAFLSSAASADKASGDLDWLEALAAAWPSVGEAPVLDLQHRPGSGPLPPGGPPGPNPRGLGEFRLPWSLSADRETYLAGIRNLQASIRAGESYEACLTNEIRVAADADPFDVYRILRRTNPAPYAAYLRFPQARILSASPERFLKLNVDADAERRLSSRPIKGTRRRGATAAEDAVLEAELAANPKDRSENLMIVDLVRNDFGKVCVLGSVTVPEMMKVERHPTVFQLVSGVEGRLEPEISALDAVRACFPGGSMTGAPKKRTMELLEARENRPRGVFSGALGWFGRDGSMDLGMVIRTLVHARGEFRIGCGGAILAESDPAAEFDEALLKAYAPLRAVELGVLGHCGEWSVRIGSR